ncbi:hypothetical protein DL770_007881 [Monosporascus sp. CRB-9-2]|nr:hypothetical protein DL770_007881 [Monosporascus sp. CRB-9-2]
MATYLAVQEVLTDYFDKFVAASKANQGRPMAFMSMFHEINWKRTANAVRVEFVKCAAACKAHMTTEATPKWVVVIGCSAWWIPSDNYRERIATAEDVEKPTNLIREFTNEEIEETLFTFSLRLRMRPAVPELGCSKPLPSGPMYSIDFIKELLRRRPPLVFAPYLATKNLPLMPTYIVPKGSMIIPSYCPALRETDVYPNPDVVDPERWISGDALRPRPKLGSTSVRCRMTASQEAPKRPGDCVAAACAQYGIPVVANSRSEMLGGWFNPSNFEINLELVKQVQELATRKGHADYPPDPGATTAKRLSENDRIVKLTDAELEEIEPPGQTPFCWRPISALRF